MNQQPQNNADDGSLMLLMLAALVIGGPVAIWYFAHEYISMAVATVLGFEARLLAPVSAKARLVLDFLSRTHPADMTPEQLWAMGGAVGDLLRWPIGGLLVWMGWRYRNNPVFSLKNFHTLESFIRRQASVHPTIAPIVDDNPQKDTSGRWAEAMKVEQWMEHHGVPVEVEGLRMGGVGKTIADTDKDLKLRAVMRMHDPAVTIRHEDGSYDQMVLKGIVERHRASSLPEDEVERERFLTSIGMSFTICQAFQGQLTRMWSAPADFPYHIQGLIAAFVLKGNQKRNEARSLLNSLALCWARCKGEEFDKAAAADNAVSSVVSEVLGDDEMTAPALHVMAQHAYIETAMIALYDWAKTNGGVMAPAEFNWLKPCDRLLWYVLNSHGRRVPFIEAAGAVAHWKVEQAERHPCREADFSEAVRGIHEYCADVDEQNGLVTLD